MKLNTVSNRLGARGTRLTAFGFGMVAIAALAASGCGGSNSTGFTGANPVITSGPSDMSVPRGSMAQLSVVASDPNNGALTYQWYKGNASLSSSNTSYSGVNYSTLTIPSVDPTTAGNYYVIVRNSGGMVQSSTVNVMYNAFIN